MRLHPSLKQEQGMIRTGTLLIKVVLGAVHTLIHAFVAQDLEHSFFSVLPLREAVP